MASVTRGHAVSGLTQLTACRQGKANAKVITTVHVPDKCVPTSFRTKAANKSTKKMPADCDELAQ